MVLLETTGIADPGVLMTAFDEVETRRRRVTPSGVVCVIDAEVGLAGEARPEWRAQVDASDAFVLSKIERTTARELVESFGPELLRVKGYAQLADGSWAYLERAGRTTSLTAISPPGSPRTELVFIFEDDAAPTEDALRRQLWALVVSPPAP